MNNTVSENSFSKAYSHNIEISNLADKYISRYYPGLGFVKIAFLMREHTRYSNGQAVAVKGHKASDRDYFLHGYHFQLIFDKTVWLEASDNFREALTDQGLWTLHVEIGGDGHPIMDRNGVIRCKTRTPDFLGSPEVAARHGEWSVELREFLSNFKQTQRSSKVDKEDDVKEADVQASTMLAATKTEEGEGVEHSETVELTLPIEGPLDLSEQLNIDGMNTEPETVTEPELDENGEPILDSDFDFMSSSGPVESEKKEDEDVYADWSI